MHHILHVPTLMFSQESVAIRERLKGAYLLQHPHRGLIYVLKDGSYMTVAEYKALSMRSLLFLFKGE